MASDTLPRLKREGAAPKVGIVHFGPGAFFRAFNAVFTEEAMAADGGDWGIAAVSLKSRTARDQLAPQSGVYTSVSLSPEGWDPRQIGAIAKVLVAPEDPAAVVAAMADGKVKIVSLTITEKGYCWDRATGRLDLKHPDIAQDVDAPDRPVSAIGFIVAALRARRDAGVPPFTVLSCDNLPGNGRLTKQVVCDFAPLVSRELADWIEAHVPFPSTMVDRITPATTEADLAKLAAVTGYDDQAAVFHEPFRQWVIEDDFPAGRPAWDRVGAQMVDNVDAHEAMKLRCLNGTHSALAYLGYLAGHETIADAVSDPDFASYCEALWSEEIVPTLAPPKGEDLAKYTAALTGRYRNPGIQHRTWQIAMDGSQKLPQRLLGTITDNLEEGRKCDRLCLAVAAWMRYVGGVDDAGRPIDVRDPLADTLRVLSDRHSDTHERVAAFLDINEVFPVHLAHNPEFVTSVALAYRRLCSEGSAATVRMLSVQNPATC